MGQKWVCTLGHHVTQPASSCPTCGGGIVRVRPGEAESAAILRFLIHNWWFSSLIVIIFVGTVWPSVTQSPPPPPGFSSAKECTHVVQAALTGYQETPDPNQAQAEDQAAASQLRAPSAEYQIFSDHLSSWMDVEYSQGPPAAEGEVLPLIAADCARAYRTQVAASVPATGLTPAPDPTTATTPAPALTTQTSIFAFPMDPGPRRPVPREFSAAAVTDQATATQLINRDGLTTSEPSRCVHELVADVVTAMTYGSDDKQFLAQTGGPSMSAYGAASTLADVIARMYRLPADQIHHQSPRVARQGMLDVPDVAILGRCPPR